MKVPCLKKIFDVGGCQVVKCFKDKCGNLVLDSFQYRESVLFKDRGNVFVLLDFCQELERH